MATYHSGHLPVSFEASLRIRWASAVRSAKNFHPLSLTVLVYPLPRASEAPEASQSQSNVRGDGFWTRLYPQLEPLKKTSPVLLCGMHWI